MTIQTLPEWFWVKNPCHIKFEQESTEMIYSAKVQLWDGSTMLSEGLYVPGLPNGSIIVDVDIAGYAKSLFNLTPADYPAETCKNITVKCLVDYEAGTYTEIYSGIHTFVYGGKEIYDSFEIENYCMTSGGTSLIDWLTEFENPTIFAGYPWEIWYTKNGDTSEIAMGLNASVYTLSGSLVISTDLEIVSHGSGRDILKLKPETESDPSPSVEQYYVVFESQGFINDLRCNYKMPTISGGIYLRWINRLGGPEHYYFTKKDTKRPIKTTSVPVVESPDFVSNYNKGNMKVVEKEKATIFTLGATLIPIADYEVIARISQSERVDMYMGSDNWMQVMVIDSDWNTAHENDYQDIEFQITTI